MFGFPGGFRSRKGTRRDRAADATGTGAAARPPFARKVLFEAMEPRLLLSGTIENAAGTLTVLGDAAANSVVIEQLGLDAGGADIRITLDGVLSTHENVKNITVKGGLGSDTITVANDLALPDTGRLRLYGNTFRQPLLGSTSDFP